MDQQNVLLDSLPAASRAFWDEARPRVLADPASLPVVFPQLPRRIGKAVAGSGRVDVGAGQIDLGTWRHCDAAAALLLVDADGEMLDDLYQHGDMEERTMVLRALATLPITSTTLALLGEVQRTNTMTHVEAGACDSNVVARAAREQMPRDEVNRMVLKLAFLDLPVERVLDWEELTNPELSRMLQDLATEREAAGRGVWRDTGRLIARAPTEGSLARLAGALEHGDDGHRMAAAEALEHVAESWFHELAAARVPREPRPEIRETLEQGLRKG